jgi:hypothetical protein
MSADKVAASEIHKLINSAWSKEEFCGQWKKYIIVPIYKKGDKTDCTNYQLHPNFYQIFFSQG